MRRKQLLHDIEEKLQSIQQLAKKAYVSYDMEDIHQLRVNFKKMRAVIRLVQCKHSKKDIPSSLKKLYHTAGTIRDLQLHHQQLAALYTHKTTLPIQYLQLIQDEIQKQHPAYDKAYKQISFARISKQLKHAIPYHLHRKQYVHRNNKHLQTIHALLSPHITDEDIHTIRKHLKDMVYVQGYLPLPDAYKDAAQVSGDYLDSIVFVTHLKQYSNLVPENERAMLHTIQVQFDAQHTATRLKVIKAIQQLYS